MGCERVARIMNAGDCLNEGDGGQFRVSSLLFTDYVVLIADSEPYLQRIVNEMGVVCRREKLETYVNKSKVAKVS